MSSESTPKQLLHLVFANAQATVVKAHMRSFIVHLHRLLDLAAGAAPRR